MAEAIHSGGCACGSPLFYAEDGSGEIEPYLGSFDQPNLWRPTYEAWDRRREP